MRTFTPWHLFVGWILPQTSGLNLATMPTCELTIRFLSLIRDVIKYVWFWFKRWLLWIWNFVMYFLWTHSRCADVYIFTVWPFALYFISTFMRIIFSVWSNSDHIFQNKQRNKIFVKKLFFFNRSVLNFSRSLFTDNLAVKLLFFPFSSSNTTNLFIFHSPLNIHSYFILFLYLFAH